MSEKPNFAALRTLPLIELVARQAASDAYGLVVDERLSFLGDGKAEQKAAMERLADLPQPRQDLVWLSLILDRWRLSELMGNDQGGLHALFADGRGDFAPQIRDALKRTGMMAAATAMEKAMAAFGATYPTDQQSRFQRLSFTSEPNVLDERLMAIGRELGDSMRYAERVEAYVRDEPALAAWAQQARAAYPERQRVMWLHQQLLASKPSDAPGALADWPQPYRVVFFVNLFMNWLGHEGFVPFFESFAGALADDIAAALREAGLDDHARAVTSAMALFGATYPIDRNERLRRIGGADGLAARLAVLGAPLEEIPARRAADAAVLDLVKRAGMLPE
jgi:hypothetical protein